MRLISSRALMVCLAPLILSGGAVCSQTLPPLPATALTFLPGPADSTRVEPPKSLVPENVLPKKPEALENKQQKNPSAQDSGIKQFVLKKITLQGATVFEQEELVGDFQNRIGQNIAAADIDTLLANINKHYQEAGYFLCHAQLAGKVKKGEIVIRVVEGYIGKVSLSDQSEMNYVLQGYINRVLAERPLNYETLESVLLRVNDLPGQNFRAVLAGNSAGEAGVSELTLIPKPTSITASLGVDNMGSKFLGPYQANMFVGGSVLQLNETSVYALGSVPFDMLNFGSLHHSFVAMPDVSLELNAGVTRAHPEHTLESLDIDSFAVNADAGVKYQWIRQRRENLSTRVDISMRNVNSEIAGAVLTQEQERVVHMSAQYDRMDDWQGSNVFNFKISQGIDGLGASNAGDLNLSRAQATPDFTKAELNISRLQEITSAWSALLKASGQLASGPLFSSEEFGYGGENFGRAFDNSELVGDHGFAAGLELRYDGMRSLHSVNLQPYVFYDYGYVANDDVGQVRTDSAASTGMGLRFATEYGQSGGVGISFPINHSVLAPLYSKDRYFPRIMFQFSQNF